VLLQYHIASEIVYTRMNTSVNQNRLEHKRVLKLAREYREQGYSVCIYPSSDELPAKLVDCSLDLIAQNGSKVVATNVRSRESLSSNGSLSLIKISEIIQEIPGWEFELVVTNTRKKIATDDERM
jgi:REase_AHJR-like